MVLRYLVRLLLAMLLAFAPLAAEAAPMPAKTTVVVMACSGSPTAAMMAVCVDCCMLLPEARLIARSMVATRLSFEMSTAALTGVAPSATDPPPRPARNA